MYIYILFIKSSPHSVFRATTDTDMALEPSFSFPQSHLETTSRTSPFNVNQDDVGKLESCETFQIIRNLLIRQQNSTCVLHCLVLYCTIHSVAPWNLTLWHTASVRTITLPRKKTRKLGYFNETLFTHLYYQSSKFTAMLHSWQPVYWVTAISSTSS